MEASLDVKTPAHPQLLGVVDQIADMLFIIAATPITRGNVSNTQFTAAIAQYQVAAIVAHMLALAIAHGAIDEKTSKTVLVVVNRTVSRRGLGRST